jgi:SP family general alpha glucoside:H+ symporter-like MFS transporter
LGQLIGVGVIKSMLGRADEWAYRIPYALQWIWPVPLFIGIALAPESPWWLIRKGRVSDAKDSLLRLTSLDRETGFDADETIAMMVHTTALEAKAMKGASYLDCFRGVDRRRTEIVCLAWAMQNLAGNSFSNYSTYFLVAAGVSQSNSYSFAMGQYAINMLGVFGAWSLMAGGVGRRTLYLYGLVGLCAMLFAMGFLGLVPAAHKERAGLATGSIMILWAFIYQLTVGTVCYSIVAEVASRRLAVKSIVLGRNLYNVVGIVCSVLTPYMLNPSAWNWSNFAGFFWAGELFFFFPFLLPLISSFDISPFVFRPSSHICPGADARGFPPTGICFLCVIYTYFRMPEPRGRTFAELDLLFERKVRARDFARAEVDVFDEQLDDRLIARYKGEGAAAYAS